MIKKILEIDIINFQAHSNTHLDADSSMLILGGESNNGKSSIIRALGWLISNKVNRLSPDDFISHKVTTKNKKGEYVMSKDAQCSVSIKFIDENDKEHTITRTKSKDENFYLVDNVKLSAIGVGVPEEVSDLLAMREANIQKQTDNYFLLTLTPGQITTTLNQLVHLDTIDIANKFNKSEKTKYSSEYKQLGETISELKVELDHTKHIPQLVEDFAYSKELYQQISEYKNSLKLLNELTDEYNNCTDMLLDIPNLDTIGSKIKKLQGYLDEYYEGVDKEDILFEYVDNINENKKRLKRINNISSDEFKEFNLIIDEYIDANSKLSKLNNLIDELKETNDIKDSLFDVDEHDIKKLNKIEVYQNLFDTLNKIDSYIDNLTEMLSIRLANTDESQVHDLENLVDVYIKKSCYLKNIDISIEEIDNTLDNLERCNDIIKEYSKQLPEFCPICNKPLKECSDEL